MAHYSKNRSKWTTEQLVEAVKENFTYANILRQLGLVPSGGNYAQLKKYCGQYGLSTDHILGQAHWRGRHQPARTGRSLEETLVKGLTVTTSSLRLRLIREGLLEARCYKCRSSEWNGLPIPLELEYINGDRTDNRLENLTVLCPNCHAQTPTYRGRNIKTGRKSNAPVSELVYEDSLKESAAKISMRVRVSPGALIEPVTCYKCGKAISKEATRCKRCARLDKQTKIQWPTLEWLKSQIEAGESYCSLGRKLGVTDNAIRKRIKNHGE